MFKTALGYFFLQLSLIGLVINLLVLIALIRLSKRFDTDSGYLIAIVTLVNDNVNLLINIVYFAPTLIKSSYIISDRPDAFGPMLLINTALLTWYMTNFIMILMGVNRLCVVVFHQQHVFTRIRILTYLGLAMILSILKLLLNIFVIPCCVYMMDHEKYGYVFRNPDHLRNTADLIDSPIQLSIFVATLICYGVVFHKIRSLHKELASVQNSKHLAKRARRERSYVIQFASVTVFFIICYGSFRIIPLFFGDDVVEINIIVPLLYSVDCSANGLIYLFMNQEVRNELMKKMFKAEAVHPSEGGPEINQTGM